MKLKMIKFIVWWTIYILWFIMFLLATSVVDGGKRQPIYLLLALLCLIFNIKFVTNSSVKTEETTSNMKSLIRLQLIFTLVVYFKQEIASFIKLIICNV